MRIEVGDHALDRGVDELAVLDGAHIIGAHALERIAEEIELAIGRHVVGAVRGGQKAMAAVKPSNHAQSDECDTFHDLLCLPQFDREPWRRIDAVSVLTQLEVEPYVLADFRHSADRFARQHLIPGPHIDPVQSGQNQIVSSALTSKIKTCPVLW